MSPKSAWGPCCRRECVRFAQSIAKAAPTDKETGHLLQIDEIDDGEWALQQGLGFLGFLGLIP